VRGQAAAAAAAAGGSGTIVQDVSKHGLDNLAADEGVDDGGIDVHVLRIGKHLGRRLVAQQLADRPRLLPEAGLDQVPGARKLAALLRPEAVVVAQVTKQVPRLARRQHRPDGLPAQPTIQGIQQRFAIGGARIASQAAARRVV